MELALRPNAHKILRRHRRRRRRLVSNLIISARKTYRRVVQLLPRCD